jgi:YfiH family protein
MEQVHGTHVAGLDGKTHDGIQADGAVTASTHLACTVMVADCLPVLLCNAQGSRVAAVHAGWRGLAGQGGRGVLEVALTALTASGPTYATEAGECLAWLGPCIGPQAFEVGDDVRAAFVEVNPGATTCFAPLASGKWLADLPALARQRLQALGVTQIFGNDGSAPWCTVNNPSRFFSYRRDGVTGRLAACIWRDG